MPSRFVIRIDDIAPGFPWQKFAPLERTLCELGITPLVGVVPRCRDEGLRFEEEAADFWDRVRSWQSSGWSIAQHGYTHEYVAQGVSMFGRQGPSEFAGLPHQEQRDRLATGKQIMQAEDVWQGIFMAPAHGLDTSTAAALVDLQFRAVTDGWGLYAYETAGIHFVPQLFAGPTNFGFGVYTVCIHVGPMTESRLLAWCDWLRQNAQRCIGFEAALGSEARSALIGLAARQLTAKAIPGIRRARSLLSGGAHG